MSTNIPDPNAGQFPQQPPTPPYTPPGAPYPPQGTGYAPPPAGEPDPAAVKLQAILAYIGFLVLIPLLTGETQKSSFVKFHVNQGLVLFIVEIICGVVGRLLQEIPGLGWIASAALGLATLTLSILGILSAINQETKPLPLIGGITVLK